MIIIICNKILPVYENLFIGYYNFELGKLGGIVKGKNNDR